MVHFSHSVVSDSVTPWTATCQASLSITNFQSLLKFISIKPVMPSNHLVLCHPLLLPSIFPSIRVFSNESALCIGWPEYWSFSISPSNEYSGLISFRIDWFDLFLSKGLSRVFSNTTVQKHQFLGSQASLWSNSLYDYWKNQSFDSMGLCWQSTSRFVIAFLPRSKRFCFFFPFQFY